MNVKEGDKFPAFSLSDDRGDKITNANLTGRVNVLYFYPRDRTPGCTKEACGFRDNMSKFTSTHIPVYGVSTDSIESHQKFKTKDSLNFPLLSDSKKELVTKLGIKSISGSAKRVSFLIDNKGVILKIYPNVTPTGHSDEILNFISGLKKD